MGQHRAHTATNSNYLVGQAGSVQYHDYFVFNLSTVTQQISAVQLVLSNPTNGYSSPDPTETYSLFDVSTPLASLEATGTGQTAIFNDLGSGTALGSRNYSAADNGAITSIPLNSSAVNSLNAARGGQIAVGGALTTISGTATQEVFAFTGTAADTKQLVLTVANSDFYSFNLNPGDNVTIGLKDLTGTGTSVALLDPAGNVLAAGVAGATNFDSLISDFPSVLNPGKYYIMVSGQLAATYNLVITKNAVFDTEPNSTSATAQAIDSTQGVLGAIQTQTPNTVVPNANTNTSGGSSNSFPFNLGTGTPSMRYQQIYSHTQFASGGVINAISFRRPVGGPTFSTSGINVQIDIGYAATTVATVSPTFASNRGSGMVTVFNGLLSLSSNGTGTPTNPFDIVINVASLFNYNPAQGDLLVDIFMFNNLTTTPFDSVSSGLGATARVFSTSGTNGVISTSGTAAQSGLVTSFGFVTTPVDDWYSINLTSTSNELNLATSTPAGGPGQFVNNLVPMLELYNSSGVRVASGTVGTDGRNQVLQYLASVPGTYRIRVFAQSTIGEFFLSATTTGQSPTPSLSSLANIIVDDGTAQRSMVRSLTIDFNGTIVSAPSSAFTLTRTEDGLVVPVTASAPTYIGGGDHPDHADLQRPIAELRFTVGWKLHALDQR